MNDPDELSSIADYIDEAARLKAELLQHVAEAAAATQKALDTAQTLFTLDNNLVDELSHHLGSDSD